MNKIEALNDIVTGLGGTGGYKYEIQALNAWAVLVGAAGGYKYEIQALNAIDKAKGGTGLHKYNIDALNSICKAAGGSGVNKYEIAALAFIGSNVNQTWGEKMLSSYMALNPEQAKWFNTTEVATIAERNALSPAMGQWCYVANAGSGTSKEYCYDANTSEWIDALIDNKSTLYGGSSGKACKEELINRFQEGGYLYTTFGPDGQNRATASFIYLLLATGDIPNRTFKYLSPVRFDRDGTAVTGTSGNSGFPAYTIGVNKGIITLSVEHADNFSVVTNMQIYTCNFRGASPKFILPNTTGQLASLHIGENFFCGEMPNYNVALATKLRLHQNNFIGTLPLIIAPNCTEFWVFNNKFSGICPALFYPKIKTVTSFRLDNNKFQSFEVFIASLYANRALFTDLTDGAPGLNLTLGMNAEPLLNAKLPEKAYNDGDIDTGKYNIHIISKDPATEGFRKWNILHNTDIQEKAVIFTFDDGYIDHLVTTRNLFNSKGVKCTHYVTGDYVGSDPKYLTGPEMLTLHNDGFDIQCHGKTHTRFDLLTPAQVVAELEYNNALWILHGLPSPKHTAYPHGSYYNDAGITGLRLSGRGGLGIVEPTKYINNILQFKATFIIDGHSLSTQLIAAINTLLNNTGYVIFLGHGVYTTNSSESGYFGYGNPTKASAISEAIDYCLANNIAIKTISDVFTNRFSI